MRLGLLWLVACGDKTEDTAVECADRADNDKNGLVDCQEPGCAPFCDAGTLTPTGGDADTDVDADADADSDTDFDTGDNLVVLSGTLSTPQALNLAGSTVELLGSTAMPAVTAGDGVWSIAAAPGTYAWRVTPDNLALPTTGTVITIAEDTVLDVNLPGFIADLPLPLNAAQLTTGFIVDLPELQPPAGQPEAVGVGATYAALPLPIEGVREIQRMFHMRPVGHTGTLDITLIYPHDPEAELWALDPVSGQWRSFGAMTDIGSDRIRATQSIPWVTTVALVVP
jgi:hypothetical protein